MGAMEAFLATWSHARATFGEGTPETGATFDSSTDLHRLESVARTAAAAQHWSGGAATAYDAKNSEHADTLAKMADLDRRIGAEVDRSAAVIARGREELDAVRQWVLAAASSVPKSAAREQMIIPIVGKGSADMSEIITRSNGELAAVGGRIGALGDEYAALSGGGIAPKEGNPPPVDPLEEILREYQVSEDPDGALDWEPSGPLGWFTDPKHVTAGEARILDEMSPFELRDLQQITEAAAVEAKVRFPPQNGANDTADNHTDAFRHAYWNALMTQRFGEQWTRDFTTAHERLPNNPATAEAMDLYNNQIGRQIAVNNPDASPEQLADLVEQAVNNGDTVVVAPSGDELAWSNTIPLGDAGTTTPATVPGRAPVPTGTGPDGQYDPGAPGGFSTGGY